MYLNTLLDLLLDRGFRLCLTSGHGNIEAEGCGRPADGAVVHPRGERVGIYPDVTVRRKVKERFPTTLEWALGSKPNVLVSRIRATWTRHPLTRGRASFEQVMNQANIQPFQISGRQQLVYRSLMEKSESVAVLYECALRVLFDDSNPGRLFLAAHSIREMATALPKVLDLPVFAEQGRLGDQVSALEPIWAGAAKSQCHKEGDWSGELDGPLQKLLGALHKFFQWWKDNRPKRRDVATEFFKYTDPSGLPLPEALEKKRVERWLALHDYFVRVAHRSSTTETEFESSLEELEQIVLNSLYRRPSEDFSAIDAILAEETPNA